MAGSIYRLAADLRARFESSDALLTAVAGAMRDARTERAFVAPELEALKPYLYLDDLLGQVHQALSAPLLESAYRASARDRRKFTAAEIPAVTQLFTPKFVVEYLLQNTLGKLWLDMHPDSGLGDCWGRLDRQISTGIGSAPGPIIPAAHLRICDPACGTMNFGLVAVDMLRQIHREEIDRAGEPGWPSRSDCSRPDAIDSVIIQKNLVGFDIDPQAIDVARRSLELKIGRAIADDEANLLRRDSLFDVTLRGGFDVVVTNPPYLSSRNLDPKIVGRLKKRYPAGWRDHYACFLLRCLELLRPGGGLGILSMHSFMFTGAFERMRREIAGQSAIQTVAHFGPGLFNVGNPGTLQTAGIVLQRNPTEESPAVFHRLVDADDKETALRASLKSSGGYRVPPSGFATLPRSAWMYWISRPIRRAFAELATLGETAPPRQGLATTDNARFVRFWWEVEAPGFSGSRNKWKPYAKGGRFRRWYEAARHRVNWEDDGREIKQAIVNRYPYLKGEWQWVAKNSNWYGREGITYSYLTSGSFSARRLEPGTIFDVAGSSLFPVDVLPLLGILNSSAAAELLGAINPTVNFQVGDLRQLPVPGKFPGELRTAVADAVECTRALDRFDETSVDFIAPEPWNGSDAENLRRRIAEAEQAIDRIVTGLYGMASPAPKPPPEITPDKIELARRWISFAVGTWLGRWGDGAHGRFAILAPLDAKTQSELENILVESAGENAAREIISCAGGLGRFLAGEFLPWHQALYRGRPVFWGFSAGEKIVAVAAPVTDETVIHRVFAEIGASLPPGWRPCIDDGFQINLSALAPWIAGRKLKKSLAEIQSELHRGRFAFSQTARCLEMANRELTAGSDRGRPKRPNSKKPASTAR